jgi:hypothetical protein
MGSVPACSDRFARNINSFSSRKVEDVLVRASDRGFGDPFGVVMVLEIWKRSESILSVVVINFSISLGITTRRVQEREANRKQSVIDHLEVFG